MKSYTNNPFIVFNNRDLLADLLDQFWADDEIPKSFPSLCVWLNVSKEKFYYLKKDPEFELLLERAELQLEAHAVNHGFLNDRTFARFVLETQHGYSKGSSEVLEAPKLHIEVSIEE